MSEENELRIVDVTGSGDAKSNLAQPETQVSQPETQECQPETQESQTETQESKDSQETQESQESQGEAKVKAPLSKEEKVARNLKKRQRTKRKVAEIRAEAKALGYRTPALMNLRKKNKKRKMNIPFVLNFPAEEAKVTTMAQFRYGTTMMIGYCDTPPLGNGKSVMITDISQNNTNIFLILLDQ